MLLQFWNLVLGIYYLVLGIFIKKAILQQMAFSMAKLSTKT